MRISLDCPFFLPSDILFIVKLATLSDVIYCVLRCGANIGKSIGDNCVQFLLNFVKTPKLKHYLSEKNQQNVIRKISMKLTKGANEMLRLKNQKDNGACDLLSPTQSICCHVFSALRV